MVFIFMPADPPEVEPPAPAVVEEKEDEKEEKEEPLNWNANRPFVADVNGDGVEDILGQISHRADGKSTSRLAAVNGKDFKLLWMGAMAPRYSELHYTPSRLLLAHDNRLQAFEPATGKQAWKATLSDKIVEIYEGGEVAIVQTKDKAWSTVSLKTGEVAPRKHKPYPKFKLLQDRYFPLTMLSPTMNVKPRRWSGLTVKQVFCPPGRVSLVSPKGRLTHIAKRRAYCYFPVGLAYAVRAKGSKIPFLVGFDVKSQKILWQHQVTEKGSLDELERGVDKFRADLLEDRALFVYKRPNRPFTMELRSTADGKVLWSKQLSSERIYSAVLTRARVYITHGRQSLVAHDAKTGRRLARIGE